MTENNYKLINMEDIEAEDVEWFWEGFIPVGKLTILQGDPGKGKTMAMLNLIAAFTTGRGLLEPPGSPMIREPINVIYQTAEDGLADTIKPRLVAAGADCSRVSVIDEGEEMLSMTDERLVWACAELPRDKDMRVLASTKCSLTYPPEPVAFRLSKERGFEWEGNYSITAEELLQGAGVKGQKTIEAKEFLAAELPAPGEYIPSTVLMEKAKEKKIAEKTLRNAMKDLGIKSHKEADRWFTGYAV